jgi:hypothetical protein
MAKENFNSSFLNLCLSHIKWLAATKLKAKMSVLRSPIKTLPKILPSDSNTNENKSFVVHSCRENIVDFDSSHSSATGLNALIL